MGALFRFDLEPLIEKYGLINYIETGGGLGTCLEHAQKYNFKRFYSIELDPEFAQNLLDKFGNDKTKIVFTDSPSGLVIILSFRKEWENKPTLFWLDAHFVGNPDHYKCSYEESIRNGKESSFPLFEELKSIKSLKDISKDVFIIDDFVLYEEFLPCEWVNQGHKFQYRNLVKELNIDLTSSFLYKFFENTHNIEIDLRDQGYFIATPK